MLTQIEEHFARRFIYSLLAFEWEVVIYEYVRSFNISDKYDKKRTFMKAALEPLKTGYKRINFLLV